MVMISPGTVEDCLRSKIPTNANRQDVDKPATLRMAVRRLIMLFLLNTEHLLYNVATGS
jgi:hypothetical protein